MNHFNEIGLSWFMSGINSWSKSGRYRAYVTFVYLIEAVARLYFLWTVAEDGSNKRQLWLCLIRYGCAHVCRRDFVAFLKEAALFSGSSWCYKFSALYACNLICLPRKFVYCIFSVLIAKCCSSAVLYKREWKWSSCSVRPSMMCQIWSFRSSVVEDCLLQWPCVGG